MYKVESCVCDYAIYNDNNIISELIFNSRKNAEKVCEIMNLDAEHKVVDENKQIVYLKTEVEELRDENRRLKDRLQISPQGDDKIDELEEVIRLLKYYLNK